MDWKTLLLSFSIVFLAELGDKTQLTALTLTTSRGGGTWAVFIGASAALVCTTAIAVLCGNLLTRFLPERYLHLGSAVLFIIIGVALLASMAWRNGQAAAAVKAGTAGAAVKAGTAVQPETSGVKPSLLKALIIRQVTAYERDLVADIDRHLQSMAPGPGQDLLRQLAAAHRQHGRDVAAMADISADVGPTVDHAGEIHGMLGKLHACNCSDDHEPVQNIIRRQEAAAEFYVALAQIVDLHEVRDLLRRLAAHELRLAEKLCTAFHQSAGETAAGKAASSRPPTV